VDWKNGAFFWGGGNLGALERVYFIFGFIGYYNIVNSLKLK
jgi:hypothetical protein